MARKNKIDAVSTKKDTSNGDVKEIVTSPMRVNTRQRSRSKSIEKDLVASAEIERRNTKLRRSSRNGDKSDSESVELKMDSNNLQRLESIHEVTDGSVEGAGPLSGAPNTTDIPMLDLANVPLPEPKDAVVIKIPTTTLSVVTENPEPKEDKDAIDLKIADEPTVPEANPELNQASLLERKDIAEDINVAETLSGVAMSENKDKRQKTLTSYKKSGSAEDSNLYAKKKAYSRSRSASSSSSDRSSSRKRSSRKSSKHSTSRRKSPLSSRYHRKSTRSSRHSSHKADDRSRSRSSDNSSSARKKRDDRKRKEDKEKEDKKLRDSKVEKKDKDEKPLTDSKEKLEEVKEKCTDEKDMSKNMVEEPGKEDSLAKKSPIKDNTYNKKEETSVRNASAEENSSLSKDETSVKKTPIKDLSDAKNENVLEANVASKDSKKDHIQDAKSKSNASEDRDSFKRGSATAKDNKRDSSREKNHRRDSTRLDSKRETSVRDRISFGNRRRSSESPLKESKKTEGTKDAKKIVDRCLSTEIEGLNEAEKGDLRSMIKEVTKEIDENELASFKPARKVTLNRSTSAGDEEKEKPKRRKWGSSAAYIPSLEISSNSLKSLIPDVKPLSESELTLKHSCESSSEEEWELEVDESNVLENIFSEEEKLPKSSRERKSEIVESLKEESEDEGRPDISPKKKKKSDLTETKKREKYDKSERKDKRDVKRERIVREISPHHRKKHSEDKMERSAPIRKLRVEAGPAPSSKLYIAAAKNPVSNIVIIHNLTRPFTIKSLKDMLQRTGRLAENGFWMDRIKSVCLAKFVTVDQAEETRVALHGVKWPTTSPKNLIVDFTTEEDLKERLSSDGSSQVARVPVEDPRRERKKLNGPIREWDLAKMGERSPGEREREKERQRREREEERLKEKRREPSPKEERKTKKPHVVKSVDDLFRKTKAQPYIYWLPLSSEQIAEKEALRRKKMAESERMLAEIKEQEKKKREKERELLEKEREKKREREREREKERMAKRSRSRSRRRSRSRSQRKSPRRSPRRSRRSPSRDSRKSHRRSRSRSRS